MKFGTRHQRPLAEHLRHAGLLLALVLAGCSSAAQTLSTRFLTSQLNEAFIPLHAIGGIGIRYAAAVAIAPNVAVTNDHNANLVAENLVLAHSRDYDLLFFRTDRAPVPTAHPSVGQQVIAYGQYGRRRRREAPGIIRDVETYIQPPGCPECSMQKTMVYDAEGGCGFSGGPVVDAMSGEVLGITAFLENGAAQNGGRRMYAYDIDLVLAEMHKLLDHPEHDGNPKPQSGNQRSETGEQSRACRE